MSLGDKLGIHNLSEFLDLLKELFGFLDIFHNKDIQDMKEQLADIQAFAENLQTQAKENNNLADLLNALGNELEGPNESVKALIEKIKNGSISQDEIAKELKKLVNTLNEIKSRVFVQIKEAPDLYESFARAMFGETLDENDTMPEAASKGKFAALYKDANGDIIVATNAKGELNREINDASHDLSATKYYRVNPETSELEAIELDEESVKDFTKNLTYAGTEKETLKNLLPKICDLATLKSSGKMVMMIGDIAAFPANTKAGYNIKGMQDAAQSVKDLTEKLFESVRSKQEPDKDEFNAIKDRITAELAKLTDNAKGVAGVSAEVSNIEAQLKALGGMEWGKFETVQTRTDALESIQKSLEQAASLIKDDMEKATISFGRDAIGPVSEEDIGKTTKGIGNRAKRTAEGFAKNFVKFFNNFNVGFSKDEANAERVKAEKAIRFFKALKEGNTVYKSGSGVSMLYNTEKKSVLIHNSINDTLMEVRMSEGKKEIFLYNDVQDINEDLSKRQGERAVNFSILNGGASTQYFPAIKNPVYNGLLHNDTTAMVIKTVLGIEKDKWEEKINEAKTLEPPEKGNPRLDLYDSFKKTIQELNASSTAKKNYTVTYDMSVVTLTSPGNEYKLKIQLDEYGQMKPTQELYLKGIKNPVVINILDGTIDISDKAALRKMENKGFSERTRLGVILQQFEGVIKDSYADYQQTHQITMDEKAKPQKTQQER